MTTFNPLSLQENPWTNQPFQNLYLDAPEFPNSYQGYNEALLKLPVYKKQDEFLDVLSKHRVVFIESGTGSGKTVMVPRFIEHLQNYQAKMVITIPRQEAVRSAADYQARLNDVELGKQIGYRFRGSRVFDPKETKMLYCTDGTLVQLLLRDPLLSDIQVVVIDEAHERNIQIDFLLFLLRRIFQYREDFQLVIMSAKANTKVFSNYFADPIYQFKLLDAGEETTFPIEEIYLPTPLEDPEDYLEKAMDITETILKQTNTGDILMFVTSSGEAMKAKRLLADRIDYLNTNTVLKKNQSQKLTVESEDGSDPLVLFMGVGFADMSKRNKELLTTKNAFREETNNRGRNYNRRISFVTNVAESSLTMKGYTFVIDCGWELSDIYFPEHLTSRLLQRRISNAQRIQRKGRVGRVGPGVAYFLYTEQESKEFQEFPTSAIQSSDLTEDIAKFFQLPEVTDLEKLGMLLSQLIEPPPVQNVSSALLIYDKLHWLDDYVSNNEMKTLIELKGKLSEHGEMMITTFGSSVSPPAAEALLHGWNNRVGYDVASVLAMADACRGNMSQLLDMSSRRQLGSPSKDEKVRIQLREKSYSSMGDFITLLNLWEDFRKQPKEERFDWARKYGWSLGTFYDADRSSSRLKFQVLARLQSKNKSNNKNLDQFEVSNGVDAEEADELVKNWVASKNTPLRKPEVIPNNAKQAAGAEKITKKERDALVLESLAHGFGVYGAYRKSGGKTWKGCLAPKPTELGLSKNGSLTNTLKRLPNWVFGIGWGGFKENVEVELATKFPAGKEPEKCGK